MDPILILILALVGLVMAILTVRSRRGTRHVYWPKGLPDGHMSLFEAVKKGKIRYDR